MGSETFKLLVMTAGGFGGFMTGIIIIFQLFRINRKSDRAEGQRDEMIRQMAIRQDRADERMNNHSTRISAVEQAKFMTHGEHDTESDRCRKEVDRRLDQQDGHLGNIYTSMTHMQKSLSNIEGRLLNRRSTNGDGG